MRISGLGRLTQEGSDDRLLRHDSDSLSDRELLESLLTFAMTDNHDVSEQAKALIARFGNAAGAVTREPEMLMETAGLSKRVATLFRVVQTVATRLAREDLSESFRLGSIDEVVAYCRVSMARLRVECFRVLFLNGKNDLIADEVQQRGTFNRVSVYPREIIRRAMLLDATGMILVHNHPSGDEMPSSEDVNMTQHICDLATPLGIRLHDHLIVSRRGHVSFRRSGLLQAP